MIRLEKNWKIDRWLISSIQACGIITAVIAVLVLGSWVLGGSDLSSLGRTYIPMADETALLFLILGMTVAFAPKINKNRKFHYFIICSAVFILIFASITLVDVMTGYRWDFLDFSFPHQVIKGGIAIGKMSVLSAFGFIFLSIAVLLLTGRAKKFSYIFSSLVLFMAYIIVVGYSYRVPFSIAEK